MKTGLKISISVVLLLGLAIGCYLIGASTKLKVENNSPLKSEPTVANSVRIEESATDSSPAKATLIKLFSSDDESIINIENGMEFLLSAEFKIFGSNGNNIRHILMHRYRDDRAPYYGWAVAVKVFNSKFRPQLYYRNHRGAGGWFSFNEVNFNEGENFGLFVGVNPGKYATAYLVRKNDQILENESGVEFLGGIDLTDISIINPKGELAVNRVTTEQDGVHVEVSTFFIGESNFTQRDRQQILKSIADQLSIEETFGVSRVVISGQATD